MPRDNRRQLARDTLPGYRGVRDDAEALPGDVSDDVQNAKAPAVGELVVNEVRGPARVRLRLNQDRRPSAGSDEPDRWSHTTGCMNGPRTAGAFPGCPGGRAPRRNRGSGRGAEHEPHRGEPCGEGGGAATRPEAVRPHDPQRRADGGRHALRRRHRSRARADRRNCANPARPAGTCRRRAADRCAAGGAAARHHRRRDRNGRPELVLPAASIEEPGLFLYFPRHAAQAPKLRAFIDAVRKAAASACANVSARRP